MTFLPGDFGGFGWGLHHLGHEISHSFRRLILHLAGGVGVGAEREPCVIVPQHTGDRLDVHAILQGQGGEGVPEIVEADVFQSGVLEDFLVEFHHRIGIVHLAGSGQGEDIRVFWMLFIFRDQQTYGRLWDGHPWGNAVAGGIAEDEALLRGPFECAVTHKVDAAPCDAAEARGTMTAPLT